MAVLRTRASQQGFLQAGTLTPGSPVLFHQQLWSGGSPQARLNLEPASCVRKFWVQLLTYLDLLPLFLLTPVLGDLRLQTLFLHRPLQFTRLPLKRVTVSQAIVTLAPGSHWQHRQALLRAWSVLECQPEASRLGPGAEVGILPAPRTRWSPLGPKAAAQVQALGQQRDAGAHMRSRQWLCPSIRNPSKTAGGSESLW